MHARMWGRCEFRPRLVALIRRWRIERCRHAARWNCHFILLSFIRNSCLIGVQWKVSVLCVHPTSETDECSRCAICSCVRCLMQHWCLTAGKQTAFPGAISATASDDGNKGNLETGFSSWSLTLFQCMTCSMSQSKVIRWPRNVAFKLPNILLLQFALIWPTAAEI